MQYPCPNCGSEKGYFSGITGVQYYDADGNPTKQVVDKIRPTVNCINCGVWFRRSRLFSPIPIKKKED